MLISVTTVQAKKLASLLNVSTEQGKFLVSNKSK